MLGGHSRHMTLENGEERKKRQRSKTAWSTLQALGLSGAIAGAGMGAQHISWQKTLDAINEHILTPAAVTDIKRETQATDAELEDLEKAVKAFVEQLIMLKQKRSIPIQT
jgi:hypothetical protein